jgi:hypothetical protein
MTGRQMSKLAMLQAVEDVCRQYRHVWNQLPAYREAFACFQMQLQSLVALTSTHRRHTGGAAQEKVQARERVCTVAFEVAAAIRAAALASSDAKTAAKLNFSLTQLRIGKDQLCLERCQQILDMAQSQQQEYEPFGVTTHRIRELTDTVAAFATATKRTLAVRSENRSVTGQLPKAFRAVENILYNQLDNLMPQFQGSAPRFYHQYQENRVMKAPGANTLLFPITETEEPTLLD